MRGHPSTPQRLWAATPTALAALRPVRACELHAPALRSYGNKLPVRCGEPSSTMPALLLVCACDVMHTKGQEKPALRRHVKCREHGHVACAPCGHKQGGGGVPARQACVGACFMPALHSAGMPAWYADLTSWLPAPPKHPLGPNICPLATVPCCAAALCRSTRSSAQCARVRRGNELP